MDGIFGGSATPVAGRQGLPNTRGISGPDSGVGRSRPTFLWYDMYPLCRWIRVALCLALVTGCTPHPVYRGEDGTGRRKSSTSSPARSSKTSTKPPPVIKPPFPAAHPVDLEKISTAKAYQIGLASYYGKKFHGRKTANGETFNMYKLTAAHRVLPLGTMIKVTNLENGRWVEVKVNDRGPFIEGRILDLSFAAGLELEMVKSGTAKVMIEITKPMD